MKVYIYRWIGLITSAFILLLLFGFIYLGAESGNGSRIIVNSLSQRMRVERLTKDVLLLASGTSSYTLRTQAQKEMQSTLLQWQKVQNGLLNGDASLGLPFNEPPDIVTQVQLSNIDFAPLDATFQQIAVHPIVSQMQVQIVEAHEYPYFIEIGQVNLLLVAHLDAQYQMYYYLETGMLLILALVVIFNMTHLFMIRSKEKRVASGEYADTPQIV